MAISGRICDIDSEGTVLHVELETGNGETVIGVFELIGWTKPPQDVKARAELEVWVPPKATYTIN